MCIEVIRLYRQTLALLFFLAMLLPGNAIADSKDDWEALIEAAKKEGQVTVYSSFGRGPAAKAFVTRFPEIKYVLVNNRSSATANRVMAEKRAGNMLADVIISGARTNYQVFYTAKILDPIKPALILPEVLDPSGWWQGKHWYVDAENEYVFVYLGNVARVASYNTKAVDPNQLKSYRDFLKPKWKGKIVARDIRKAGSGGDAARFFFHHPDLGKTFLWRLFTEMELTLVGDSRQGVDWLAQGKFDLGMFLGGVEKAAVQGLPVDEFDPHQFKEGAPLGVGVGTLGLINNAPHPKAARLFVNWYLSREGQAALQKEMFQSGSGADSMRIDIPKEDVSPAYRRRNGANYLFVGQAEFSSTRPIRKLVNDALAAEAKP